MFKGHEGLVLKFPFGTEKKTYQFWDTTLRKAFPIEFKGETKLNGLKVYVFEQDIPKQEVPLAKPLEVPGSLVGELGPGLGRGAAHVQEHPDAVGRAGHRSDHQGSGAATRHDRYNGEDKLTATQVTIAYDDATVEEEREGRDREQASPRAATSRRRCSCT